MPCGPPKPLAEYNPGNGETRPQCHGAQRGFAETEAWPRVIYQVSTMVPAWCPGWNLSEHWLIDAASPKGHHTLKRQLHENCVYCPIRVGLTPSSCGGGKCREIPSHQLWGGGGGILEQMRRAQDLNPSSAVPSAVTWAGYGPPPRSLPPHPPIPRQASVSSCVKRVSEVRAG